MGTSPTSRQRLSLTRLLWLAAALYIAIAAIQLRPAPHPAVDPLARRIPSIDIKELPLAQALPRLGELAGIRVVVDRKLFDAFGPEWNPTVTLRLHDVTLGTALDLANNSRLIVADANGDVVHITTAGAAPSIVRIYDIRDQLKKWGPMPSWGMRDWNQRHPSSRPLDQATEAFLSSVIEGISSEEWVGALGTSYSHDYADGRIVIVGSSSLHRKIDATLLQLRRNDLRPAAQAGSFAAAEAALDRSLPPIHLHKVTFEHAVEALAEMSKVNIVVEWNAMEGAGIDRAAPTTLNLPGATLRQALKTLADNVGGRTTAIGFHLEGGVVVVTPSEWATVTTEFYDLRDLVTELRTRAGRQHLPLPDPDEVVENIIKLLVDTVTPNSWRGNTQYSLRSFGQLLIMTHTHGHQRKIANLLEELDKANRGDVLPATMPAHQGK